MEIKLDINWQLTLNQQHAIDPVLFELLAMIQKQGSLQRATDKVNVSYRFAWGLLHKWQEILGQPLVLMERGRGATLSNVGQKMLTSHQKLSARFSPDLDNFATQFKREFESLLSNQITPTLNIFASHGLAIGALRSLIQQQNNFTLDLHFQGSIESLRALSQGQCAIAGFHIPTAEHLSHQLVSQYLELLDPERYQLIYVVKRNQGLMVKQSNPKAISDLNSLTRPEINFINRQADSGTRLLFDQLIHSAKIDQRDIQGYQNEEFTHMAVAAMIASDAADVGFGIEPVAEKFNLEFIPLVWEHYCLAVPLALMHDSNVMHTISLLQSADFKNKLVDTAGYDISRSGEPVSFAEIFPDVL